MSCSQYGFRPNREVLYALFIMRARCVKNLMREVGSINRENLLWVLPEKCVHQRVVACRLLGLSLKDIK